MSSFVVFARSNNNDNDHDVVDDDDEESPEAKLERERLRRQQNNARERSVLLSVLLLCYVLAKQVLFVGLSLCVCPCKNAGKHWSGSDVPC